MRLPVLRRVKFYGKIGALDMMSEVQDQYFWSLTIPSWGFRWCPSVKKLVAPASDTLTLLRQIIGARARPRPKFESCGRMLSLYSRRVYVGALADAA